MSDNLLQEIDAAMRADRAASLWQKHKTLIIGIAAAIVCVTAVQSIWQYYREVRGGRVLAQLEAAKSIMLSGQHEQAAKGFAEVANDTRGEVKALALVWQSRALTAAGKTEEAAAALTQATETGASLWSDLACLRLAGLNAAAAKPCLGAKDDSPLQPLRAQWAAANAWEQGDAAGAMKAIEAMIADEKTAETAREQLTGWLAVMKAQEGKL